MLGIGGRRAVFLAVPLALALVTWLHLSGFLGSRRVSQPPGAGEPKLAEEDAIEIRGLIKANEKLDPRIISIELLPSGQVRVTTGFIRGRLFGGGENVRLEKEDGRWRIVSVSYWVS